MDILFQSQLPMLQVEYRITSDLSGAVIGDIPSPVRVEEGNAPQFQQLGRDQQVSVFPALADRQHGFMFAEKQFILSLSAPNLSMQQCLKRFRLNL